MEGTQGERERVVVAVTGGPESATLLQRGARIAARSPGSELLAVHVLRADGAVGGDPAALAADRVLVESLGGTFHTVVGEDVAAAVVDFAHGVAATLVVVGVSRHSRWRAVLLGSTSTEVARLAGHLDVHLVSHERAGSGRLLSRGWSPLSARRRAAGWVLALAGPPALTALLHLGERDAALPTQVMLYLVGSVAVALVGGLWPALACAVTSFLCLNWFFTAPRGLLTIADPQILLALLVFVLVAAAVASVVDLSARRAVQASRARAEASTLTALARSVLSGEDSAQAVVDRLAETFGLRRARLQERPDAGGRWETIAEARAGVGPPAPPGRRGGERRAPGPPTTVRVDDDRRLVLEGRPLTPGDRQVAEAFGAQAGIVLEYRRLRDEAARAAVLAEADAVRTTLLAAVSHDLRTPLAAIRAAVDGLRAPDVELAPADESELVETVADATARLERLIDDLLDVSRLRTGAVVPAWRLVSLDEVVPTALGPHADDVALDLPEDLPLVRTDPGLLERVLANVVANAVRFSPPGRPAAVHAAASDDAVEIRVVDHGPGLADEAKARMFEPFERLGDASGGGTGLGLAVARGFALAVGATLAPEDTAGGGLTMVVRVPLTERPAVPPGASPGAARTREGTR